MTIIRTTSGPGLPSGFPFSLATTAAGGVSFISGMPALSEEGRYQAGTFDEEVALAWRNIEAIALAHHVRLVEVADADIRRAQRRVWDELRVGLEGGGAAALAALLGGAYQPALGEVVGIVCSGGNVDITAVLADG